MLCPEAELNEATFNQLFTSSEYNLTKISDYNFNYDSDSRTSNIFDIFNIIGNKSYNTKLTNIPENTKLLTNGIDYFSTLAGDAHEAYKTVDIINIWKRTKPQDLTVSTSLLRGQWGSYVGLSNPLKKNKDDDTKEPFNYGELYNIKTTRYENEDAATDLDFTAAMNSNSMFFAISDRKESEVSENCFKEVYINWDDKIKEVYDKYLEIIERKKQGNI